MPLDGYLRYRGSVYRAREAPVHQRVALHADRDQVWVCHRGQEVAHYRRDYEPGGWHPQPRMRPEPPPVITPKDRVAIAPPELADYAALCA